MSGYLFQWQQWHEANPQVVLVEDYTQDPVCEWALNSHADYALSSLRKALPVPDGAMLWSPRDLQLPPSPPKRDWSGSGMRLAAMIRKRDYLANGATDEAYKTVFRDYYMRGEDIIVEGEDLQLSPWSHEYLKQGYPVVWREQRDENVSTLFKLLANRRNVRPLYTEWPKGHCPFSTSCPARSQCHSGCDGCRRLIPPQLVGDRNRCRVLQYDQVGRDNKRHQRTDLNQI